MSNVKNPCSDCVDYGNGPVCDMNCGPVLGNVPMMFLTEEVDIEEAKRRWPYVTNAQRGDWHRLQEAISLAALAHDGQTDKGGEPYLWHLLRVGISLLPDVDAAIVGVMHDIAEDTYVRGEPILKIVGHSQPMMSAMYAITHQKGDSYEEYLRAVAIDPLALKVKLADLQDNMNEQRLRILPPAEADRLRKKYREAWEFLMGLTAPITQLTKE